MMTLGALQRTGNYLQKSRFRGGFFPTHLKNMLVKLDHETPRFGVKIPKIFETTNQIISYFAKIIKKGYSKTLKGKNPSTTCFEFMFKFTPFFFCPSFVPQNQGGIPFLSKNSPSRHNVVPGSDRKAVCGRMKTDTNDPLVCRNFAPTYFPIEAT